MTPRPEMGPDMNEFASEAEQELRQQGEEIVSLLRHPEIGQMFTNADLSAEEQDMIQEIDTAEDFISKSPEKRGQILEIFNKLQSARESY